MQYLWCLMLHLSRSISPASRILSDFAFALMPTYLDVPGILTTLVCKYYTVFPRSSISHSSSASGLEARISPKSIGPLLPISFPIDPLSSNTLTFTSVPRKREARSLLMRLSLCCLATESSWVLWKRVISPLTRKWTLITIHSSNNAFRLVRLPDSVP